jgi:hypothetical protein
MSCVAAGQGTNSGLDTTANPSTLEIREGEGARFSVEFSNVNGTANISQVDSSLNVILVNTSSSFASGESAGFFVPGSSFEPGTFQVEVSGEDRNQSFNETVKIDVKRNVSKLGEFSPATGNTTVDFQESGLLVDVLDNGTNFSVEGRCSSLENCGFVEDGERFEFSSDSGTVSVFSSNPQEIRVGDRPVGVELSIPEQVIRRGETYGFRTVDNETGEVVGNSYVNWSTGSEVRTNNQGLGSFDIPASYESNIVEYRVEDTQDNDYRGERNVELLSGQIQIRSRAELLNQEGLSFAQLPDSVPGGDVLQGRLQRNSGDYSTVEVVLNSTDRTLEAGLEENGDFSIPIPKSVSELSVQGVDNEDEDITTELRAVDVIGDRDGDNVINTEDECANLTGVPRYDGCPSVSPRLSILSAEAEETTSPFDLKPNTGYIFRVFDSNETEIARTFTVSVSDLSENQTRNLEIGSGGEEVFFEDAGKHRIVFDGEDRYNAFRRNILVENSGSLGLGVLVLALIPVSGAVALVMWYFYAPPRDGGLREKAKFTQDRLLQAMGRE